MLYSAIKKHLPSPQLSDVLDISSEDDDNVNQISSEEGEHSAQSSLPRIIPKEIAEMSVALTEYFQMQRKIYEDVSWK